MAEDKKTSKSAKTILSSSDEQVLEHLAFLFFGLIILGAIATAIENFIKNLELSVYGETWNKIVNYFLLHIWPVWKSVAIVLSILAFLGIIYTFWKLRIINKEEQKIYNPAPDIVLLDKIESK